MKNIYKLLTTSKSIGIFTFLFLVTFTVNNVNSEMHDFTNITENDFEKILNLNSVKFHEYENTNNLFDDFLGKNNEPNESTFKTNFQDLSLQIDSKNLRELYKIKLLEMKGKNKINDNKKGSFFKKKI